MKEWKCLACEYRFCSENNIPYCPSCENEWLEEVEDEPIGESEKLESHHIHPKFMDNENGDGQQYMITKKKHDMLHGLLMNWLWEEIEDKGKAINNIINKSKKFIGVKE